MFSVLSNNGRSATVQTYLLDLESDLYDIPLKNCGPGDKAFVIENSKWYMMNHSKVWIEVNLGSSSGSSSGGSGDITDEIIYNGGLI